MFFRWRRGRQFILGDPSNTAETAASMRILLDSHVALSS